MRSACVPAFAFVLGCGGPPLPHPAPVRIADPAALVGAYYRAVAAEDLAGVLALLDPHPTLDEPFSAEGRATRHVGYDAIGRFFSSAFRAREDQVVVEFVTVVSADTVDAGWSLHAADGMAFSGTSRFDVHDGRIAHITITPRE